MGLGSQRTCKERSVATTKWAVGTSGSWTNAAYWTLGVPTSGTDTYIDALGNDNTTLSGLGNSSSLTISAAGVLLSETASGTLNVSNALTISAGKVALRGA